MMFTQLERLKKDVQEQEHYKRKLMKQGRENAAKRISDKQAYLKEYIKQFEETVCYH